MGWKPTEIGDLTGRSAIVTGANSGIGFAAAKTLADHGAHVTLAVRNLEAGHAAATRIQGSTHVQHLDLASLASVRAFAGTVDMPVDLLVNNAGVMAPPTRRTSPDGNELQFATNHLGHFALTGLLLPALLGAPAPRVTTVASLAHHKGDARVVEGNPPDGYDPRTSYGQTKLANLLFALELHRRATAAGSPLTSTAAHPGVAVTHLVASRDGMGARWAVRTFAPPLMRLVLPGSEGGAQSILYAATIAAPGSYSGPQGPGEIRGTVGPAKLSPFATDEDLAQRLWTISEELTGVTFAL
jgi:NAD(P)-dependent dehydrogenase (short-subunit alcohol dehydrogenase family)